VSALPEHDAVDRALVVRRLASLGWVEKRSSRRHFLYEEPVTHRLLVLPSAFEKVAPGVYRVVAAASAAGIAAEGDPAAREALTVIDALFAHNAHTGDTTRLIRVQRDAR
jgi:predicted RNA binding protein YcfA (HicA-like mRNA interferase family)